ncbi:cytochrome P450 [Lentinus tigrinus ALCF2SS1-7]|uniref:Cytochrome P450 n=1 Tax=Lentinus tigrinus ALCF2SS1-6 TaxID=1328759 RepID=A0A5C2SU66_9APHY|nr:cytochrome P450 [Lentinus tigrinus ALCF2SS1-6]RPD81422.1 cytochrome P450 [Lentinus tigrinus ALCF2SS1-7]
MSLKLTDITRERLTRIPLSGSHLYWALAGILFVWTVKKIIAVSVRNRRMPPGPPGVPILGNIFDVPKNMPWFKFTEWKQQYGPIFSLNMAGQPVVVVNSHKVTADLFDRRSNIYSDRPRFVMASEILTGGIFMVFSGYTEVWRKMRRAGHEGFNLRASEQHQPMQAREAGLTVLDIIQHPDAWDDRLKQATASSILTAVYGWPRISAKDKPVIQRIHAHTARIASAVVPGRFLVDIIPAMKYLPTRIAKWKREGLDWHERETEMFEQFNQGVSDRVAKGESPTCFVASLIETEQRHGLTKKEAAWLAGIMFSAGAETTSASMMNFVLAMLLFPDAMRKAQAELDAVVGRDRLPSFEDRKDLPYIRALVKEVLRWRPVGPLAVPRRVTEDDWYEGYLIPKGTMVIPNVWGMNHDPEIFPDPEAFRPERFLDDETGTMDVAPPDTHGMGHVTFGFGRRICVGLNFANQALFINFAAILWAMDISKAVDATGREITPDPNDLVDAGVVVGPAPFPCKMTPRFSEVERVLERELGHAA